MSATAELLDMYLNKATSGRVQYYTDVIFDSVGDDSGDEGLTWACSLWLVASRFLRLPLISFTLVRPSLARCETESTSRWICAGGREEAVEVAGEGPR